MTRLPALLELLHEDLPQDDVVLVLEDGAEDHRHPVRLRLHVHRLVVAVVNHRPLIGPLRRLALLLKLEVLLEDGGEAVSLQEARLADDRLPLGGARARERLQVKQQRDIVVVLRWSAQVLAVLPFQ